MAESNGARDALVETLGRWGVAAVLAVLEDGELSELDGPGVAGRALALGVTPDGDALAAELETLERDSGDALPVLLVRSGYATLQLNGSGYAVILADAGADALAEALEPQGR